MAGVGGDWNAMKRTTKGGRTSPEGSVRSMGSMRGNILRAPKTHQNTQNVTIHGTVD